MLSIDRISTKQENSPAASWYEQEIAAMAQGDMQALCRLYERTRTAVYGFALSILKKPADAEDVLQDTYIRLFHAAGRYVPQGKPMAFIFTITAIWPACGCGRRSTPSRSPMKSGSASARTVPLLHRRTG